MRSLLCAPDSELKCPDCSLQLIQSHRCVGAAGQGMPLKNFLKASKSCSSPPGTCTNSKWRYMGTAHIRITHSRHISSSIKAFKRMLPCNDVAFFFVLKYHWINAHLTHTVLQWIQQQYTNLLLLFPGHVVIKGNWWILCGSALVLCLILQHPRWLWWVMGFYYARMVILYKIITYQLFSVEP